MIAQTFCLIDTETTGISGKKHEIIDIAILKVCNGTIVDRYESLVKPKNPINGFIQNYTGISNQMVADAPSFAHIADEVENFLSDGIFVAHNAGFDHSFLKNEFARIGREFERPRLCTVKLSRHLYPEYPRHGLDAIIERFEIECKARHRAMGDTEVLWEFLQILNNNFDQKEVGSAMRQLITH